MHKSSKSKFQPLFDYFDERLAPIEADIKFMKERLDICIANIDKSERRWELNDRRFNRQMELLENHHKRVSALERKAYI